MKALDSKLIELAESKEVKSNFYFGEGRIGFESPGIFYLSFARASIILKVFPTPCSDLSNPVSYSFNYIVHVKDKLTRILADEKSQLNRKSHHLFER